MARVTTKKLGLTKPEVTALKRWRNGWGTRLWRDELRRLWAGQSRPLDDLYSDEASRAVLVELRGKIRADLYRLEVSYTGPDRD